MKQGFLFTLILILAVLLSFAQNEGLEHYLIMQKIQDALENVILFKNISEHKISVSLDPPFELYGYFYIDKFIDDFSLKFSELEIQEIEWVSKQLEEQFAVQSLTLLLKNKRSEKNVYYKLIIFLAKKDEEWKIYYLRGLKI